MEMFNEKERRNRIGPLHKNDVLNPLREVEKYLIQKIKEYPTKISYDVIALEMPFFETIGYTEYGTCFIMAPLNIDIKMAQMREAYEDPDTKILDYAAYFIKNIKKQNANKYKNRKSVGTNYPDAGHLVVLPGSNKLKEKTCLNKLRYIKDLHDTDVYFKPHPLTKHVLVGELKDIFRDETVLPRDADLYEFLEKAHTIYSTHISESVLYASVLEKEIEPIDVFNQVQIGSFYHINHFLFECQAHKRDKSE